MMKEDQTNERLIKTLAIFSVNVCLACGCSILGPTLLSMGYLLHTDTFHMALALAAMRLGFLLGTLTCGVMYTRIPIKAEVQFVLGCTVIAVTLGIAPWLTNVYAFLTASLLMGVGCGYVDAGSQPYLINLWKAHKLRNSLLQALHFNWSVTATITPYIISLFLVDLPHSSLDNGDNHNHSQFGTSEGILYNDHEPAFMNNSKANISNTSMQFDKSVEDFPANHKDYGKVRWSYVLLSLICLVMTLFILLVYFYTNMKKSQDDEKAQIQSNESNSSDEKDPLDKYDAISEEKAISVDIDIVEPTSNSSFYKLSLLTFLFMYAFLYQCVEGIPGGFLTMFCAEGLGWHLEEGAILTTVFWGMLGIGRLSSMLLAWSLSPRVQIIINMIFLGTGYLLLQFVYKLSSISMWFSVALVGLGLGSCLPSSFLWITDYMPMTSYVSASAMAGNSLAGVVILPLTGYLLDQQGPQCLVPMLGVYGLCFILLFTFMQLWASYGKKVICREELNSLATSDKDIGESSAECVNNSNT